jgi:hypothetical protein
VVAKLIQKLITAATKPQQLPPQQLTPQQIPLMVIRGSLEMVVLLKIGLTKIFMTLMAINLAV